MFGIHTKNLRGDLFGGVTAGVVALPLALAFGEASGAGPIAGLYGAIIVGFLRHCSVARALKFQALQVPWWLYSQASMRP